MNQMNDPFLVIAKSLRSHSFFPDFRTRILMPGRNFKAPRLVFCLDIRKFIDTRQR
jgi:hypothetical protein